MKISKLFLISFFLIVIGAGYIFWAARVFVPECYTQNDFFRYHLMTPDLVKRVPRVSNRWYFLSQTDEGSGLRTNEIIFTNIKESDADALGDVGEHLSATPRNDQCFSREIKRGFGDTSYSL